jgi:hypothetical protein
MEYLDNHPAYTLIATFDSSTSFIKVRDIGTIVGGKHYSVVYFATPENYLTYLPIVDKMVDSFQIVESIHSDANPQSHASPPSPPLPPLPFR